MRKTIVWDMDGVIIPGRGTTWLAKISKKDPDVFIKRILDEAGCTGPLVSIPKEEIEHGLKKWTIDFNKGEPISSMHQLAKALTDLRHEVKRISGEGYVFASSEYTKYTKNLLLADTTEEEIENTARMMVYNQGVMETIKSLREKFRQVIFSDSIAPLVHKVSQHLGIEYGDGNPTYVKRNGQELLFESSLKGYALSGKIDESWVKLGSIKNWIQKENIPHTDLVFIDDNKLDMLREFSKLGSLSIIYYNSKDAVAKIDDYKKGVATGFHGVEDDLSKAIDLAINC